MSQIAGWVAAPGTSAGVLDRMLRAPALGGGQGQVKQIGPAAALALGGGAADGDLYADETMWAAIIGRPRWTHEALAAIARGRGQGAALAEAFRRYGENLFTHLNGGFALAVIAGPERRLMLAVDRFGIERMCYAEPRSGGLVFATSADALRAHPDVGHTIAPQSVFDFLFFGICPSPGTIYREQHKLLPAQFLLRDEKGIRTGFHWQMPYRETTAKGVDALSSELMARLRTAVRRAIEGRECASLGAFLSGGLDSSTVAGLLREAAGRPVGSFTIGFSHDQYDEMHYAEVAARHFGTVQHNYILTPKDVVALLPEIARAFDEPFGNSSVVPTYCCARLAREHGVKTMLAGDGGDEIFGGNSRYVDQKVFGLYGRMPAALRRGLVEPLVFHLPGLDRWSVGRKARSYIARARLPMPDRTESYNFYRNADLGTVFTRDMLKAIDPEAAIASLREPYERTISRDMVQRMMHMDLKITLADNDLRKVGIGCAMAGVEVAYPFLDEEVVDFAAAVPASLLIRGFERRWFFKQAVRDFLAAETLAKRKHGFGMPFMEWPREDAALREIAVDCLAGFKERGYLRTDFLDRVMGSNDGTHDALVWDIVTLELWLRARADVFRSAERDAVA